MIHPYSYYLERAARWYPGQTAVIEGEKRLTYSEMNGRVSALARALVALGVRRGDRVAVLQANNHQFMEALAGAARAGAAFVPVLGILTESDHSHMVADSGAAVLIAPAALLAARARALKEQIHGLRHVIAVEGGEGLSDYEALLKAHAGEAPVVRGSEDEIAQILTHREPPGSLKESPTATQAPRRRSSPGSTSPGGSRETWAFSTPLSATSPPGSWTPGGPRGAQRSSCRPPTRFRHSRRLSAIA